MLPPRTGGMQRFLSSLVLLLSLRYDALQAKPAFALRPYARGWRLGGAGPCKVWWGAHLYQPDIAPPLLQDVMFDYFLRMMPLLNARSAVLLPPSNASAGRWCGGGELRMRG